MGLNIKPDRFTSPGPGSLRVSLLNNADDYHMQNASSPEQTGVAVSGKKP
jgi:hypothetical protein